MLEELAFKLVFDDQGLSHNHLVSVSVTSEGAVRPPEIDDWEEMRLIRGERVSVSLSNEFRPEQHESVIREIEAAINELWHDIESVLVSHLHELYNTKWREESEVEISQQEFLARMQLNGVHVMEDRAFDLYFLDNQLFNGRTVELFVDSEYMDL